MSIQQKTVNTIRMLAVDAVSRAKSGHPGICLDAAPVGYALFADIMKYNPKNPAWENRDRFVLSSGHGSALLYALLHLFGFGVTKDDLMSFRQFGSKTPGHPEYGVTAGVDASTGPLGQGIANAVGMALAEARLAAEFNRPGYDIVDHFTYALCGEGCLEEGISYEACSFAGAQKLGKLILFYDRNNISIEGDVGITFNEDIRARFASQGWHAVEVEDINDLQALESAVDCAKSDERPSVIICNSVIGYGSPLAGSSAAHGTPLNTEQLNATRKQLGCDEPFVVSDDVKRHCDGIAHKRATAESAWREMFERYKCEFPDLATRYAKFFAGYEIDFSRIDALFDFEKSEATRISGGKTVNRLAAVVPNLICGSADLSPSTKSDIKNGGWFSPANRVGRNIGFGIREHAMAGICNGIALHGGLRVLCSTFFTFTDYMKGAMRMSALMGLPVIYMLTHDSIGVGEDGPTHQPIEQLASLRATPDINVFRPCDGKETAAAFLCALKGDKPTAIVLSRQDLPQYEHSGISALKGGYVIDGCENPDVLLIATGSEVSLCSGAKDLLEKDGIKSSVVSMPCIELFSNADDEYKNSVLPNNIKARVCVEAGAKSVWREFAGDGGDIVCMNGFGLSAPSDALYEHFGFTPENIAAIARKVFERTK